MNAQLPVRRLVDDYRFHLARTELQTGDDEQTSPPPSQTPALADDSEHLSRAIRSSAFAGMARGFGLAVKYVFDPGGTGAVVFNWRILLDERCEPTLVVHRNGKKFREESQRMAGEFPDLLARNERYQYRFGLVVGGRELERPAICELVIPPFKAAVEPMESAEARRLKRDAWKKQEYALAERWTSDPQELIRHKAEIDEAARQKFGEM